MDTASNNMGEYAISSDRHSEVPNNAKLNDYEFHEGDCLYCKPLLGYKAVFPAKIYGRDTGEANHRVIGKGLNWIGVCFNRECLLYDEVVICQRGIGQFDI